MAEYEQALLISVDTNQAPVTEAAIEEMIALANADDIEVQHTITQRVSHFVNSSLLGSGKKEEIAEYLQEHPEIDLVLFLQTLSPLQHRNLNKAWEIPILDRTQLILEIFRDRASTREAKLQIEAAQLKNELPRLAGGYEALGRQRGGKNKGQGEKQIEMDRRHIKSRMADVNRALRALESQRGVRQKARTRSSLPLVALVGYTNAGKSTLMNAILSYCDNKQEKQVYVENMLFATLETSVRRVDYSPFQSFLLTDTVGFVSDLPHELVEAFHATLEDIKEADLLIQVVDRSDPFYEEQCLVTHETLHQLGAGNIPMITVYNKADQCSIDWPHKTKDTLTISAQQTSNIEMLLSTVCDHIFEPLVEATMVVPYTVSNFLYDLRKHGRINHVDYLDDVMRLQISCLSSFLNKYSEYLQQ